MRRVRCTVAAGITLLIVMIGVMGARSALAQAASPALPSLEDIFPGGEGARTAPPHAADILPMSDDTYRVAHRLLRAFIVWRLAQDGFQDEVVLARLLDASQPVDWSAIEQAIAHFNISPDEELLGMFRLDSALADHLTTSTGDASPAQLRDAQMDLYVARVQHDIRMMDERERVIRITNWISWIIFLVAHAILAVGLWAAVREFLHAAETRKEAPAPPDLAAVAAATPAEATRLALAEQEIRVSLEGIALKTTLHGVVLLAMAIGFYFLYLKFVYPVTVVGS